MTTITLFVTFGILVSILDAGVSMHNQFYCYSTDPIRPLTHMHSSFTSYEVVRSRTPVDPTASSCNPSGIWMLFRHGGVYPLPDSLQDMINLAESSIQADIARNYAAGRATLCRQDFEAIRDWTINPNLTMDNARLGTPGSISLMRNIARRYQQFFPTILTNDYSPDRFHFRHIMDPETNTSIRAFASGLFGEDESQYVIYETVPDFDWFLYPKYNCPALAEETANQHQREAFQLGPEIEEMAEQVNRKLGFHGSNQLSLSKIFLLWKICILETGESIELSNSTIGEDVPWCSAFSMAHHLLLEYDSDLRYFYLAGYGVRNQRLVENLNCGLMQDLLKHMQSDNTDQTARIYVTHSQMLLALLVTFGSFRDTSPITQHNFAQQTTRQWLTSLIIPNAGNIVVVRYNCADGDHDLLFLLNERPLLIEGCGTENGICKLSFIVNRFQRFIDVNCEERFCTSDW